MATANPPSERLTNTGRLPVSASRDAPAGEVDAVVDETPAGGTKVGEVGLGTVVVGRGAPEVVVSGAAVVVVVPSEVVVSGTVAAVVVEVSGGAIEVDDVVGMIWARAPTAPNATATITPSPAASTIRRCTRRCFRASPPLPISPSCPVPAR